MRHAVALLVVGLVTLAGCATRQTGGNASAVPFQPSRHPGIWVADDVGYVLDIDPQRSRLFHSAGTTCVEDPAPATAVSAQLAWLRERESADALLLAASADAFAYRFQRVATLPAACLQPLENTPPAVLQALADDFTRYYPFFELHGVDWAARVAKLQTLVHADTGERLLFDLLRGLLLPLRDAQIRLEADIGGQAAVYEANPGKTLLALAALARQRGVRAEDGLQLFRDSHWSDGIGQQLLQKRGTVTADGRVQYGMLTPTVGYLAVRSELDGDVVAGDFNPADGSAAQAELDAALDAALRLFNVQQASSVIVDLSLHRGDSSEFGPVLAGRFASTAVTAATVRLAGSTAAAEVPLRVVPSRGARFTGPVYLLTSGLTVGNAEVATLALRALQNVRHAGESTRGALSSPLHKPLPYGWRVTLSHQIYTDHRGQVWEGRGIEPAMRITVFDPADPLSGHLQAVWALLQSIDSQASP